MEDPVLNISESLVSTLDIRRVLSTAVQELGTKLEADRCVILLTPQAGLPKQAPIEWSKREGNPAHDLHSILVAETLQQICLPLEQPHIFLKASEDSQLTSISEKLKLLEIDSILALSTQAHQIPNATILLYRKYESGVWKKEDAEFLSAIGRFLGTAISNCAAAEELSNSNESASQTNVRLSADDRYRTLVEQSDAIIFSTDPEHKINFISQRAFDFFGVAPEDFTADTAVHWFDLVHLDDRDRVTSKATTMQDKVASFEDEFRIVNHLTGTVRWMLVKLVPVKDSESELHGWDGFGIDITARREAQEALDAQSKKVRALYTVSSAIRGYLDPANIASRGMAALCDATGADAGLCYLFSSKEHDILSLVAHHGFSPDFVERVEASSTLPSLSTYVAEHGQSVVVPDIRTDPRASKILSEEEGVRSAVLVPISVEEETLGTLGLFHREVAKFDGGDVMLVSAAANQIGLAARQANLFSAYRKQTKNLAALYRLSHELSGFLSLEEIFQNSFNVIRDELGLKRLWLGLLNETGTRIVGQAAYGPGWKRRLVEINVEVSGREHPIAQVVATRKPIVINDPEKVLSEFGVRRFFSRFAIKSVGLVPLVSGGQVLGVLAFQPAADSPHLDNEELTLLSSLASEIAASLLAKRLEERVGSSEKMRTSGLLAAGIAHNFNNLLQGILGQASLLDLQSSKPTAVKKAASIINDSATKGADLVKQLLSFANLEEPSSEICDLNMVIDNAKSNIKRELQKGQKLSFSLTADLPRAVVDPRQLLRILLAIVNNADEATDTDGSVHIFTDSITVTDKSPHYEVPFGDYIRIGVRDNGEGMDAETKRRCFEPFYTTKNVDPSTGLGLSGAGLGLAAAYALARKNGGRLVADSRKGHGSVFTLYVPVAEVQGSEQQDKKQNRGVNYPPSSDSSTTHSNLKLVDQAVGINSEVEQIVTQKSVAKSAASGTSTRRSNGKSRTRLRPKAEGTRKS